MGPIKSVFFVFIPQKPMTDSFISLIQGEFRVMFSRELCQIPEYKLIESLAAKSFAVLKELISEVFPKHISESERQNQVVRSWASVHGLASLRIDGNLDDLSKEQFYKMVKSVLSF